MSKVLTTLRTHWKKSVFFTLAGCYGAHRAHVKHQDDLVMEDLCRQASDFGRAPLHHQSPLYRVTVILNPAADGGKARKKYENYCAPILHLAGIKVHVVRTEAEGQAKKLMELVEDADAVLVAGGDGTVMEAVTGLMRRPDADRLRRGLPVGVLPVGESNRLAKALFPEVSTATSDVRLMASAAMSCVRQLYRPMDVLQVENISEDSVLSGKKIYGMTEVQMGAFRDAHDRLSKYWYWAGLKRAAAYAFGFTTAASLHTWHCSGDFEFAVTREEDGDDGAAAASPSSSSSSWWHYFFPSTRTVQASQPAVRTPKYEWDRVSDFRGVEINIASPCLTDRLDTSPVTEKDLRVNLGPEDVTFAEFVSEGWRREREGRNHDVGDGGRWTKIRAPSVRFRPCEEHFGSGEEDAAVASEAEDAEAKEEKAAASPKRETYFYVDRENVEVRGPFEVSLLPDRVVMFCSAGARAEVKKEEERPADGGRWWMQKTRRGATGAGMPSLQQGGIATRLGSGAGGGAGASL